MMIQTKLVFEKRPTCDGLYTPSAAPAALGVESPGLSKGHISADETYQPKVTVLPGTSFLKVSIPKASPEPEDRPNFRRRGRVGVFSARSRRRLLQTFARTLRNQGALMSTLTYPGVWVDDPRVWKKHLDNFFRRLRRAFPKVSGIWKLEFQRRGAPHFHLIFWGAPTKAKQSQYVFFRDWVARTWYEVVGSGDRKHLLAGTEMDEVHSHRGAISYAAKYVAKDELPESCAWLHCGRWWGVFRRKICPFGQEFTITLKEHEARFLLRLMRRQASRAVQNKRGKWRRRRVKASTGFVYLCDATAWARRLEELCALASSSYVDPENAPF